MARCGLGRFLLSYAEADARSQGSKGLFVMSSLTAVAFYQKCGYVPFEKGSESQLNYGGVSIPVVGLHKTWAAPSQPARSRLSINGQMMLIYLGCFAASLAIALLR